jgi:hypothetical protein
MATVVDCPSCARKLRLPTELVGRTVKCASCGNLFEARDTPTQTPLPVPREEPPPERPSVKSRSKRRKDPDWERCPFCDEEVKASASRCKYCGERLDGDREEEDFRPWERRGAVRRDCEPHRAGLVLTLGIVSIACGALSIPFFCCYGLGVLPAAVGLGIGIPAWVMGQRDLAMMREGVKDPAGRGSTQGGWICAIVGTILNVIGLLIGAGMLVLLLIGFTMSNTTPPPAPAAPPPTTNPPGRRFQVDPNLLRVIVPVGRERLA